MVTDEREATAPERAALIQALKIDVEQHLSDMVGAGATVADIRADLLTRTRGLVDIPESRLKLVVAEALRSRPLTSVQRVESDWVRVERALGTRLGPYLQTRLAAGKSAPAIAAALTKDTNGVITFGASRVARLIAQARAEDKVHEPVPVTVTKTAKVPPSPAPVKRVRGPKRDPKEPARQSNEWLAALQCHLDVIVRGSAGMWILSRAKRGVAAGKKEDKVFAGIATELRQRRARRDLTGRDVQRPQPRLAYRAHQCGCPSGTSERNSRRWAPR